MNILAISGSARRESLNTKMLVHAVSSLEALGADVTLLDWQNISLPLFHGDLDADGGISVPDLLKVRRLFHEADGCVIAAPEYNGSITPLLKNTLDWVSRSEPRIEDYQPFAGKVAGLMSTSGGKLGGLRGLVHVRQILNNLGMMVVPRQYAMPEGGSALAAPELDETHSKQIGLVAQSLFHVTRKLRGS